MGETGGLCLCALLALLRTGALVTLLVLRLLVKFLLTSSKRILSSLHNSPPQKA